MSALRCCRAVYYVYAMFAPLRVYATPCFVHAAMLRAAMSLHNINTSNNECHTTDEPREALS